jgi:hypothetical protein
MHLVLSQKLADPRQDIAYTRIYVRTYSTTITRKKMHVSRTEVLKEINGMSPAQSNTFCCYHKGTSEGLRQYVIHTLLYTHSVSREIKTNHRESDMFLCIIMPRPLFQQHNVSMRTKITFYLPPLAVLLPTHKSEQSTSLSIESSGP